MKEEIKVQVGASSRVPKNELWYGQERKQDELTKAYFWHISSQKLKVEKPCVCFLSKDLGGILIPTKHYIICPPFSLKLQLWSQSYIYSLYTLYFSGQTLVMNLFTSDGSLQ